MSFVSHFVGTPPKSKSILIRWYVLASYVRDGREVSSGIGLSPFEAQDSLLAEKAFQQILAGNASEIDVGFSAAVLRFFSLRLSRIPGEYRLRGAEALFKRPHRDLVSILNGFGVFAELTRNSLLIQSGGWRDPNCEIQVGVDLSSQFASAIALNCWALDFPLKICFDEKKFRSRSYFDLTLSLCKAAGLETSSECTESISIPGGAALDVSKLQQIVHEPDHSSAFAIAAIGALLGKAEFQETPCHSLQPDVRWVSVLSQMGADVQCLDKSIIVTKNKFFGITIDLAGNPDLFPVLSILCAFAKGPSTISGIAHLVNKESNRLAKVLELLHKIGVKHACSGDSLVIYGQEFEVTGAASEFLLENDHRLAMALTLAQLAIRFVRFEGLNCCRPNFVAASSGRCSESSVVAKSYPRFYDDVRRSLRARWALVGHRGVGKTSILSRLKKYSAGNAFDLDEEVLRREEKSPADLSEVFGRGESYWRAAEERTLRELLQSNCGTFVVALGAGFSSAALRKVRQDFPDLRVLWLRRVSDSGGRVFLDRPRVLPNLTDMEESRALFKEREPAYEAAADQSLWIPEGFDATSDEEAKIFRSLLLSESLKIPGVMPLIAGDLNRIEQLNTWDPLFFELRTDLLSCAQILFFVASLRSSRMLISFRSSEENQILLKEIQRKHASDLREGRLCLDWALELGPVPKGVSVFSISAHDASDPEVFSGAVPEAGNGVVLKFAPAINSFQELLAGHRWAMEDPRHRTFLPRDTRSESLVGRWVWYRLWTQGLFPLQFFRDGCTGQKDLPFLLDWLRQSGSPKEKNGNAEFGAVLGDPVSLSRSPSEHWKSGAIPFYAISVSEGEWDEALAVLSSLGLTHAAVTSPLKKKAGELINRSSSINTLFFDREKRSWSGIDTDVVGFRALLGLAAGGSIVDQVVIWGGGGILSSLYEVCPHAVAFSARTGLPRSNSTTAFTPQEGTPFVLVWAAPDLPNLKQPPQDWRPTMVCDLSYSDSSPAKAWAKGQGIEYRSGLTMFFAQAAAQKEFWR